MPAPDAGGATCTSHAWRPPRSLVEPHRPDRTPPSPPNRGGHRRGRRLPRRPAAALASTAGPAAGVPAESTHAESVAWALDNGVSVGCTATNFCPDDPVTRAQTASLLMNLSRAGVMDAATVGGLDLHGLDERFAAPGPAGPQGEPGQQGPAGAAGSSAEVEALTGQVDTLTGQVDSLTATVDALTEQIALLQYGSTVVTATLRPAVGVNFSSPTSGSAGCSTSPCEYLTFAGHAMTAWFNSTTSYTYTCGAGEPPQTATASYMAGFVGTCEWKIADGGVPAGDVLLTAGVAP